WAGAGVPWPQLLLGLANNHSWDWGAQGAVETMAELERQGILHCGLRSVDTRASVAVREQHGLRIGVLAVTWGLNAPGADIGSSMQVEVEPDLLANEGVPSLTSVRRCVHALQERHVDLVFALVHWGHEFECLPTAQQRTIAVELHALGVDVVCGSHSHVVQPAEVIEGEDRETLVLYSVGNATTAMFTDACRASVLVELRCWRDLSGRGRWAWAGADLLFNLFPGDLGPRRSLERIDTLLGDDLPPDLLRRLKSGRARLRTQLPAAGSGLP
ncbi:MAG: CapA family protein, partial [Chromatiales bacterium]